MQDIEEMKEKVVEYWVAIEMDWGKGRVSGKEMEEATDIFSKLLSILQKDQIKLYKKMTEQKELQGIQCS